MAAINELVTLNMRSTTSPKASIEIKITATTIKKPCLSIGTGSAFDKRQALPVNILELSGHSVNIMKVNSLRGVRTTNLITSS